MKKKFVDKVFRRSSIDIIDKANEIISEYQDQGFTLTLRQLYYQFVSRDLIKNQQTEYKRLGQIVSDARLAGLIDWNAIEDRTRFLRSHSSWSTPASYLNAAGYAEDLWASQPFYAEVWIEKDALVGVIQPVCEELRLPYFACRGYTSQSELYEAGRRLASRSRGGKRVIILHLGDHDPSGIDMTRDITDRVSMFAGFSSIDIRRLALNWEQVEEYSPPPNPAKDTDSRHAAYVEQFGDSSWELDALDPNVISDLIRDEIDNERDQDAWDEAERQEEATRDHLQAFADRFDELSRYIDENPL
ncbi:hypothetical protein [Pleomorphomonas oryzae]|uniref:hypothetical protein n=1 Tax=Pleomorphomonas oryzae TaxID=261934 RepID=UPI00040D403C|nr:hypothetical protein [Pleomorphomonas oryzae]